MEISQGFRVSDVQVQGKITASNCIYIPRMALNGFHLRFALGYNCPERLWMVGESQG